MPDPVKDGASSAKVFIVTIFEDIYNGIKAPKEEKVTQHVGQWLFCLRL